MPIKAKLFKTSLVVCIAFVVAATAVTGESQTHWTLVGGTRLPVPPPEHPRLYLRAEHVAELPTRLKHPVLRPTVERLQAQALKSPQLRVEWDALQYLVTRDAKLGRAVVEAALSLLQKCELAARQDACRETGRMMVTGAIVYDCLNYYWRTIAHNSLLVFDPNEDFGKRGYGNDGGQRLPNGRSEPRNLDALLAPAPNAALSKVGGPGKEYWVFGTNYTNDPEPERVAKGSIETSAWRLELSPQTASAEDRFLAVMQMTDLTSPARWPVRRTDAGERTGCLIEAPGAAWLVLLHRDSARSANPVEFTVAGPARTRVLVTDLVPGRWQGRRKGSPETHVLDVPEDSGAAWFEATAGTWTLRKP